MVLNLSNAVTFNIVPHVVVPRTITHFHCYLMTVILLLSSILVPKTIRIKCFLMVVTHRLRTLVLAYNRYPEILRNKKKHIWHRVQTWLSDYQGYGLVLMAFL